MRNYAENGELCGIVRRTENCAISHSPHLNVASVQFRRTRDVTELCAFEYTLDFDGRCRFTTYRDYRFARVAPLLECRAKLRFKIQRIVDARRSRRQVQLQDQRQKTGDDSLLEEH